jgi:hypothetical protein
MQAMHHLGTVAAVGVGYAWTTSETGASPTSWDCKYGHVIGLVRASRLLFAGARG